MATRAEIRAKHAAAEAAGDVEAAKAAVAEAEALLAQEQAAEQQAVAASISRQQPPAPIAAQPAIEGLMPGTPAPVSSITGLTASQAQRRGEAGMQALQQGAVEAAQQGAIGGIRYGVPLAVGFATGGVGLAPALAMGGTILATENIAQFLEKLTGERKEMEPLKSVAGAVAAGAPILRFAEPVAGASPRVASFLLSTVSAGLGSEGARAIEAGEMFPESKGTVDNVLRFTIPPLAGIAARLGSGSEIALGRAKDISATRGGANLFNPDGTIANVALGEANPALFGMEQRAVKKYIPSAVDRMVKLDENLPAVASRLVAEAPDATPVAQELMQNMQLNRLRDEYAQSERVATATQEAAQRARLSYSSDARKLMADHEVALRAKMRAQAAFDQGLSKVGAPKLPSLFQTDSNTIAQEVQKVAKDSVEAVKLARSAMYDATGVQINDAVVGLDDVLASASAASKPGGLLAGARANERFLEAISDAFGQRQSLTREEFLEFKNAFARRLANGSTDPKVVSAAEKLASEQYGVVKNAAESFIERTYGQDILKQWKAANGAYAQSVDALGSDVVDLLANGRFKEFFNQVVTGGKNSPAWKQLNQYSDFLSGVSKEAIATGQIKNPADLAVADNFRQHVNAGLLKGMFDASLVDGAREASMLSGVKAIDPEKFVRNVAALETRGGFPIKEVFGADTHDFRRLARFIGQKFDGRITQQELTDWLSMLPKDGVDPATKALIYRKSVKDALIDPNLKRRFAALRKAEGEARAAGQDVNRLRQEYQTAANDPLVRFFADTNFKIDPNDYVNNANLAERIVQEVDPVVMKQFIQAAAASGKSNLVSQLGDIAAANAVRRFIPQTYENSSRLSLRDIADFFNNPGDKIRRERENVALLIGQDRFNLIKKELVEPISSVIRYRQEVQGRAPDVFNDLRAISAAYGGASGTVTSGMIVAQGARSILQAVDNKMYNVATQIYLNPKFSRDLQAVGYDLVRFAQLNPLYATQVNLAMTKDQATQGQPTR
jgi:hypothetical protein